MLLTLVPLLLGSPPDGHVIGIPGGLHPAQHLGITQVLEDDGSVFVRARRP